MIVKITTFLLFSYWVQSTGPNSNDIGVPKILQCYAMLAEFEDIDYWLLHRYFNSGILPYFVTLLFHHIPLIFLTWKFQDTSRHRVSKKGKKKFWKIFIFDRDIRHWWIHGNSIKTKRGKGSVLLMYVYMYCNCHFMSYGAAGPPRKLQVLKFS